MGTTDAAAGGLRPARLSNFSLWTFYGLSTGIPTDFLRSAADWRQGVHSERGKGETRRFSPMYSALDFRDMLHMLLFYHGALYLTNGLHQKTGLSENGCTLLWQTAVMRSSILAG